MDNLQMYLNDFYKKIKYILKNWVIWKLYFSRGYIYQYNCLAVNTNKVRQRQVDAQ